MHKPTARCPCLGKLTVAAAVRKMSQNEFHITFIDGCTEIGKHWKQLHLLNKALKLCHDSRSSFELQFEHASLWRRSEHSCGGSWAPGSFVGSRFQRGSSRPANRTHVTVVHARQRCNRSHGNYKELSRYFGIFLRTNLQLPSIHDIREINRILRRTTV